MTSACSFAAEPAVAREVYLNAQGKTRVLRYYPRSVVRRGRFVLEHRVAVDFPQLERATELHRFARAEQARECWREQRRAMACGGYTRIN